MRLLLIANLLGGGSYLSAAEPTMFTVNTTTAGVAKDKTTPAEGKTLLDNECITLRLTGSSLLKAENKTIESKSFTHYLYVRSLVAPTKDNLSGGVNTEKQGSPLILTAKKDMTIAYYYRKQGVGSGTSYTHIANDGKDTKVIDHVKADSIIASTLGTTYTEAANITYLHTNKTFNVQKGHTYTIFCSNSTSNFYGLSYTVLPTVPEFVEATVQDGAVNIPVSGTIELTYDQTILLADDHGITIAETAAAAAEADATEGPSVTAAADGAKLTVTYSGLDNEKAYTLNIPAGAVKGKDGEKPTTEAKTIGFTTIADLAKQPVLIMSTDPAGMNTADGATGFAANSLSVTFNKDVENNENVTSPWKLEKRENVIGNNEFAEVPANGLAITISDKILTLSLAEDNAFDPQTTYRLTIAKDALKEKDGTATNNEEIVLTFTTKDTRAPKWTTAPTTADVPVKGKYVITFDEPMKVAQNAKVTFGESGIESKSITLSGENNNIVNIEYEGLAYSTSYTLNLGTAVTDNAGNAVTETITFTTAADTKAPVLDATKQWPAAGMAAHFPVKGEFILPFDEAVQAPGKATVGDKQLEITVDGKVARIPYEGLEPSTEYTLSVPAGAITDKAVTPNAAEAIEVKFTTAPDDELFYTDFTNFPGDFHYYVGGLSTNTDLTKSTSTPKQIGDIKIDPTSAKTRTLWMPGLYNSDSSEAYGPNDAEKDAGATINGLQFHGKTELTIPEVTAPCRVTVWVGNPDASKAPIFALYAGETKVGESVTLPKAKKVFKYTFDYTEAKATKFIIKSEAASIKIDVNDILIEALDLTAPIVSSVVPANEATDVAVEGNIVITYSEPVELAELTDEITVKLNDAVVPATDITVNGEKVTIAYKGLASQTAYQLSITEGAIVDKAGNKAAAWSTKFTTADILAPVLKSVNPDPALGAIDKIAGEIVLTFDENIALAEDAAIAWNGAAVAAADIIVKDGTLTVKYPELTYSTQYTLLIPAGAVTDGKNAIAEPIELKYTVKDEPVPDDTSAPALVSSDPANDAADLAVEAGKVTLTFDEEIIIADAAKITMGDLTVTPSVEGKVLTVAYPALAWETKYTLTVAAGAVKDNSGNATTADITVVFTTMPEPDTTAPALVSSDPANDAAGLAVEAGKVTLTFDEEITIADATKITMGDLTVTPSVEGKVLTIAYPALAWETKYTLTVAAGAVKDNSGNATTADITVVFTTMPEPDTTAPALVSSDPANDAAGLAVEAGKVTLTFDEEITIADAAKITMGDLTVTPSVEGKVLTVAYPALAWETKYTLTVAAGAVKDNSGNATTADITVVFTTMPEPDTTAPALVSSNPADNGKDVAVDAGVITLVFDEDVILSESHGITFNSVTVAAADITVDAKTVKIAYAKLNNDESYTLNVPAGAFKDAAGNETAAFSIMFTTVKLSGIAAVYAGMFPDGVVVYDLSGRLVLKSEDAADLEKLPQGFYIVNGEKIFLQ